MDLVNQLADSFGDMLAKSGFFVFFTGVLTFLLTLLAFYNQVAVPMYNKTLRPVFHFFKSVYDSPEHMEKLDGKLDLILGELKTNGGHSIKDQLNRLENLHAMSEAQRYMLLDASVNGVWISDEKGETRWVNDPLKEMVNGTQEDFVGKNWINIVFPQDRETVALEWENAIKHQRDFNLYFRLYNLKDNSAVPVHAKAQPVFSFLGKLVGYNGTVYKK